MICITYICLKMKHMTDGKATDLKDFICFLHFIKYKANPHTTDTYCVIETVVIHNATTCPVILTLRNQYIRSCCCD